MDVFVSYASRDKPVADAVVSLLERRELRCWYAPRDIRAGTDYPEELIAALKVAKAFVVIVSRHSMPSPHVRREVERAIHYGVTVIPFRIEDIPMEGAMEFFLAIPHWLDALTPPLEGHIERLATTIKSLLGATPDDDVSDVPNAQPDAKAATEPPTRELAPDDWTRKSGGRLRSFFHRILDDTE